MTGRRGAIARVVGTLLLMTSAAMALPIFTSIWYGELDFLPLVLSAGISAAVGAPLWWRFRHERELASKDAFFIATFGWVLVAAVSALPFVLHGSIPSFTDAFFEMMSGYTTTGATILNDIEALPHGLLMWRSETHFLGGMGFLTLAVLLLPRGMIGVHLFRAESSPGQVVTREQMTPRNHDAMVYLWRIYVALNAALVGLLMAGGMTLFDAVCHAFGTVSTSGYSTYNTSMAHFDSAYLDWVTTLFMFLGGVTFMLFYFASKGDWEPIRRNTEFRWYAGIVGFFCAAVSGILWWEGTYAFADSLRFGSFQVVSLLTTTGFATADYELWPQPAQMLLYVVCFVGASAGSTTSGIKIVHYVLMAKFLVAVVRKAYVQPLSVVTVRLDGRRVEDTVIYLALAYFIVNIIMVLGGGCIITLTDDVDVQTAMSAVIATLMNIGPGFGDVGPTDNFAGFSDTAKWFFAALMLIGRLEMFSALALLYPSYWRS